jgi:hypothetical protein
MVILPFETDDSLVKLFVIIASAGKIKNQVIGFVSLLEKLGYHIDIISIVAFNALGWE